MPRATVRLNAWLDAAGPGDPIVDDPVLNEVRDALDDDLDTPRALAAIDAAAAAGQGVSAAASLLGVELAMGDEEPVKTP